MGRGVDGLTEALGVKSRYRGGWSLVMEADHLSRNPGPNTNRTGRRPGPRPGTGTEGLKFLAIHEWPPLEGFKAEPDGVVPYLRDSHSGNRRYR